MKNSSLTRALFVAGAIAAAGIAHAETFDSPMQAGEASTMTRGVPNALTTNSPYSDNTVIVDTRVLGAGPVIVVPHGTTVQQGPTYLYSAPAPVMEHPSVQWQGHRGYSTRGSYYGD